MTVSPAEGRGEPSEVDPPRPCLGGDRSSRWLIAALRTRLAQAVGLPAQFSSGLHVGRVVNGYVGRRREAHAVSQAPEFVRSKDSNASGPSP